RTRRGVEARAVTPRGAPDDLGQLRGRADARAAPRVDDRARDAPRVALLAELVDHVRQLLGRGLVHEVGGTPARALVHPHVERPLALHAEAALRRVELQRADTQVQQLLIGAAPAEKAGQ